jgi:surface antigen
MFRALLLAAPLALVPLAASAPTASAATSAATSAAQSRTGENCQQQNQRNRRRGRGIGGVLGGIAGGRLGPVGNVVTSVVPVGSLLGEAVAGMLDCREQQQAAAATQEAVARAERGGDVGASSSWQSETRPNVSGTSTVTAVDNSGGDECMSVSDIIIVDGQETEVPKRMCRRPPTNRYVRV